MTTADRSLAPRRSLLRTAGLVAAILAGCGRGPPPSHPAAPASAPQPARAARTAIPPPAQTAGFVSDLLPMGYWLSLDHRLKQPDTGAPPKGVVPNLTYRLDEGIETLSTDFGEQLARWNRGEPSRQDCLHAAYGEGDLVDVPKLPSGVWFCARDKAGHLAKIRLDGVDEDRAALRLAYWVWK